MCFVKKKRLFFLSKSFTSCGDEAEIGYQSAIENLTVYKIVGDHIVTNLST